MTPKQGDRLLGLDVSLQDSDWEGHHWRAQPVFLRQGKPCFSRGLYQIKGPGFNYQDKQVAISRALAWLVDLGISLEGHPYQDPSEFISLETLRDLRG